MSAFRARSCKRRLERVIEGEAQLARAARRGHDRLGLAAIGQFNAEDLAAAVRPASPVGGAACAATTSGARLCAAQVGQQHARYANQTRTGDVLAAGMDQLGAEQLAAPVATYERVVCPPGRPEHRPMTIRLVEEETAS